MKERDLFRATQLPVLQNRMFATRKEAMAIPRGDVVLIQNQQSGLVYNNAFDPDKLVYDYGYQNEQAHSLAFKKHLSAATEIINKHFRGMSLLEIGCGKGYFLEHLQKHGFRIIGIDPAYEGDNSAIVKKSFNAKVGISAEGVVLRHMLEHVRNPVSFLADVALANRGSGNVYIEVPCFDWIIKHRAWFDVFYEHVNYFRVCDFLQMFGTVLEIGHLFGGQYLYVVAKLSSLRDPAYCEENRVDMPPDFLSGIDRIVGAARKTDTRRNAIWGGASKGVIFSTYVQRAGLQIDEVIDINPAKQGLYLAGTGLQVSSPHEALDRLHKGDNIFVMNSNYFDEIVSQSGNQYTYIVPDHEKF